MTDIIRLGKLEIHLNSYRLLKNGEQVRLTPTEWALLRELIQHPNQVLSHRTLLQRVWGEEYATEYDYVHTYVSRLRRKLETDASNPDYILTEAGIGYRFNADGLQTIRQTPAVENDLVLHNPIQDRRRFINPLPQHIEGRHIGRDSQREQIRQLLLDNTRLVSIYGRAGIGKTALACKVLHDLQQTNAFDGMVFLSATSTGITLGRILSDFNRLLGDTPPPDNPNTLYRITHLLDRLSTGRYILLLDNLEHLQDPITHTLTDDDMQAFFQVALSQGSTLRVLVTSRYPLNLPRNIKIWERVVALEHGLPIDEGVQLLRHSDPDGTASLRDADPNTLHQLVERTHGLPRALEAIVGLLLESPLTTPDDLLDDPSLLSIELGEMFIQGVIDTLQPDVVQALELVSLFERSVPLRILEKFVQPHVGKSIKPVLNRLIRAYFLSYNPDNQTVAMHPIDRQYCYERVPNDQRIGLHRQIATLYAEEFIHDDTHANLNDLTPALSSFYHRVRGQDYDEAATTLLQLDADYMRLWGSYAELADGYAQIVAHITAPELQRRATLRYGEALRRIGRINDAIAQFERAHAQSQQADDTQHMADALGYLGWSNYDTGNFSAASNYWQQALVIYREIGDRYGEGDLLGGLGWVSYLMGAYDEALTHIQAAFRIFGELGNQLYRIGMNIGDSGVIRAAQGDYEQAIKNLRESLSIAEVTNAVNEKSYKGGYLATTLLLNNEIEAAADAAKTAVQYDVPANRHFVAAVYGITLSRLDEQEAAIRTFEQAITYADNVLQLTPGLYNARYARALSLAGLSLLRGDDIVPAIEDYGRAKSLCATDGVIQAQTRLLNILAHDEANRQRLTTVYHVLKPH